MDMWIEAGMNLRRFEMEIDAFMDKDVEAELVKMQRILSIAGLYGVVLKTPVDTGRLRGAWLVSIDNPVTYAPEGALGGGAAATLAISSGLGTIAGAAAFSNIIIQNNVDYSEDIEDGGSTQAPAGMLAVTVAEIEGIFR